ncbi:MAG: GNAT family N-acetyltransferase [Devosia sp.]
MFAIRAAEAEDVDSAVAALGEAFAGDPLISYLFEEGPVGVRASAEVFFSILLRARIALGMPAYVLEQEGGVAGVVMGYDISRPAWPPALTEEWGRLETDVPEFTARIAEYDRISVPCQPADAHYYLGVIGVHSTLQGRGAGRALLEAFCALSLADPKSHGVFLETASLASLRFYQRNGFEIRGEGTLGSAPLWCVYMPT